MQVRIFEWLGGVGRVLGGCLEILGRICYHCGKFLFELEDMFLEGGEGGVGRKSGFYYHFYCYFSLSLVDDVGVLSGSC